MDYMRISYEKLKSLSDRVFQWYGYTREEAAIITDVMLQADLMGIESHGIQRLILYTGGLDIGRINRNAVMRVIKETPVSTVFDADDGMGQLAAHKAMSLAVQKRSYRVSAGLR